MNTQMKLETGRMLREGVSDEGIQILVKDELFINATARYAAYVEYGFPPPPAGPTVEGSVVHPVEDPARLIGESKLNV